ncbi:hypothetical protein ACHAWT_004264 [Skeletonema menzelii]|eukprot:scaffold26579_cov166-Skeletonema_menzelii.AAC.1
MLHKEEILNQLHAICAKDDQATRFHRDYFTEEVNEDCRRKMVDWCFIVVDTFNLSRESVWRAMDILDRYLMSKKGMSMRVLENKQTFQLASTVCLYMAVKVHEDVEMTINFLVKLCRSFYTASEFISMEHDILFALQWSVCQTTPLDFVRQCLLLQSDSFDPKTIDCILEIAQKQIDLATLDVYFASCKKASVGIASLGAALVESDVTPAEQEEFWSQLSSMLNFDLEEVREVERHMLSGSTIRETKLQSHLVLSKSKTGSQISCPNNEQISPVSISSWA